MIFQLKHSRLAEKSGLSDLLHSLSPKDRVQRVVVACVIKGVHASEGWAMFDSWYQDGAGARYSRSDSERIWVGIDKKGRLSASFLGELAKSEGWLRKWRKGQRISSSLRGDI